MAKRPGILIVDDKESMLKMLSKLLAGQYRVETASTGSAAIDLFHRKPTDLVLSDIRMPDMSGMDVLNTIKKESPDTEVILMTAYATVSQAVEAVKAGAYNYLTKPFEPDELTIVLDKALERKQLREEAQILKEQVDRKYGFPNIIGQSKVMEQAYELAAKAAESDTTVLLMGESGTGKELFARAIHHASDRRSRRFVAINCGAVPKALIESELFGHVRGAFSGATKDKRGLFMEADGGTLLLDEISELELDLQVKINRALQEKEVRRVGDTVDLSVDVRIIACTNRDLKEAMKQGIFREDLYYRLNVFPIRLPPLRERAEDIPLLVEHFLTLFTGARREQFEVEPARHGAAARPPLAGQRARAAERHRARRRALRGRPHHARPLPLHRAAVRGQRPRHRRPGQAALPRGDGPHERIHAEAVPRRGPAHVRGQRDARGRARGRGARELPPPDAQVRRAERRNPPRAGREELSHGPSTATAKAKGSHGFHGFARLGRGTAQAGGRPDRRASFPHP